MNDEGSREHNSQSNHRLTFLVIEDEPPGGISTRKLLLESARHNVLTASTLKEGLATFERFPNIDAVAMDVQLNTMQPEELAGELRKQNPKLRIVALSPFPDGHYGWAQFTCHTHKPADLLKVLEEMGGRTDI